jgi:hypothetical protein
MRAPGPLIAGKEDPPGVAMPIAVTRCRFGLEIWVFQVYRLLGWV